MKTQNGILYLEFAEYVPQIIGKSLYDWQRNQKTIRTLGRGGNGNPVLIEWESIPAKYQVKFKKINCENRCEKCRNYIMDSCEWNPYEAAVVAPLKNRLTTDYKAQQYYISYRFENGSSLKPEHIESYTNAASWLNLLQDLSNKPSIVKQEMNLSIGQFWDTVCKIFDRDKVCLPTSYKRLRMKLQDYQTVGYDVMISGKFGNQAAAKVNDAVSKSVLLEMIAHPHQFDDVYIQQEYNKWAQQNGYKTIDVATVGVHRRDNEHKIKYFREGENEYNKSHNLNIPRNRPSQPLFLINSDDNNLDMYFIDVDLTGSGKYFTKLVLIVVTDCYNDYVLGYSWRIAASPVIEMVQTAYLDAVYQVKKLTGDFHLWHEIKTDRWSLKTLRPFYENQAFFNPQKFKNAKSKYIEQAFGEQWHDVLKKFNGYSGHNISSKNRGVNPDWIVANKKNNYTLAEAGIVMECIINELRNLPGKVDKSITRQQEWLNGWAAMPEEHKRKVSDEFILSRFGSEHLVRNKKYPNEITNNGVKLQIENVKYQYLLPKELHQQLIGTSVRVIYDVIDMSRVLLVNEDKGIRIVAHNFDRTPGAAKDFGTGDRKLLTKYQDIKRYNIRQITDAQISRRELLKEHGVNVDAMLQIGSGNMIKEAAKMAELAHEIKQLGVEVGNSFINENSGDNDDDFDPYTLMK